MSDQSTFGASFGGAADPTAGPVSVGGAPLPGAGPTPPAAAPAPQQPAQTGVFGSGLAVGGFGQPKYTPPPAGQSPLDTSIDLTQQQIGNATNAATNPVANFFDPEGAAKKRAEIPQLTEQLQKLKAQKQQQTDIMSRARNFGVPSSQVNPNMTDDTIDNYLLDQYKKGDINAFRNLKARGKDEWLQDYSGDFAQGQSDTMNTANKAVTSLNAAGNNQAAYKSALNSLSPKDRTALENTLRQEGVPGGIPDRADKWTATNAKHGAAFAQTLQFLDQHLRQLNNMTNFDQGMPKEAADSIAAGITLGSTAEPAFGGNSVKVRSQDRQPGVVGPNGSARTDKYGLSPSQGGWNASSAERLEKSDKMFAGEDVKGALNQYNIANKFRHEALNDENYKSSAGIAFVADAMGGAGRDVAEKSAAAGTIGLTKMQEQKGGGTEKIHNMIVNEIGELQNWINNGKKGDVPRLSPETIRGIKAVAQANYDFARDQGVGRLTGAMRYAGQIGRPLEDIPLDKDLKAEVSRYHEEGRIDAVNGFNSYPSIVRGNQRVYFQQGSNVSGAQGPRAPMAFPDPNKPQQPIAPAPAGASGNPPHGPSSPSGGPSAAPAPGPGGGPNPQGGPVTIAGQNVNVPLPPGASPKFLSALQRIESGNESNPWTAGTKGSSASGAFQFINSTWAANKPPGAPNRAGDATPAQQAQGMANLTAKNAASLQSAGLPVNDTNLYVAHNLGPGGASSLLRADPNADARSVVGEAAARNNPLFFRGRPTVAQALQRYDSEMQGGGATGGNRSLIQRQAGRGSGHTPFPSVPISQADVNPDAPPINPGYQQEEENKKRGEVNPAMVGGMAGSLVGGPAGGAAGGAGGQMLENYMRGNPVFQPNVVGSAAFGAAGGIPTAGVAGMALRAGTAAAGGGAQGGMENGLPGAIAGAVEGGVGGAIGEAVGRGTAGAANLTDRFGGFLGMGGHQTFSRLTGEAQKSYLDAANIIAKGKPEKPGSLPGGGKNVAAETAYEEKLSAYEDAERHVKSVLPHVKPDEAAYAAQQVGANKGDALTGRPVAAEIASAQRGYGELRSDISAAAKARGLDVPLSAAVPIPDGPMSQLRTEANPSGKVPFTKDVEEAFRNAERLAVAPAPGGIAQVADNVLKARTELLSQERTALGGASPDPDKAKALRAGAQALLPEIERTFKAAFGADGAEVALQRLKTLDTRYARAIKLSENGDIVGTIIKGGKEGRETNQAFKALTMGDVSAQRMMNTLVAYKKGTGLKELATYGALIAGELHLRGSVLLSTPIIAAKLTSMLHDYVVQKGAGRPVTMDAILKKSTAPAMNYTAAGRAGAAAGGREGAALGFPGAEPSVPISQ